MTRNNGSLGSIIVNSTANPDSYLLVPVFEMVYDATSDQSDARLVIFSSNRDWEGYIPDPVLEQLNYALVEAFRSVFTDWEWDDNHTDRHQQHPDADAIARIERIAAENR